MPSKQFLLKPRGYVGERVHCLSGGEPLPYRGKVASNPRLVTADYREYRRVSKSIEGKILRENYSQSFNFSRTIKSTGSPCRGPSIREMQLRIIYCATLQNKRLNPLLLNTFHLYRKILFAERLFAQIASLNGCVALPH